MRWEKEGKVCGVTGQGEQAFQESLVLWVACDREVQKDHDRVCFGNTDLTRGLAKSSLGPVHVLGVGLGGGVEI